MEVQLAQGLPFPNAGLSGLAGLTGVARGAQVTERALARLLDLLGRGRGQRRGVGAPEHRQGEDETPHEAAGPSPGLLVCAQAMRKPAIQAAPCVARTGRPGVWEAAVQKSAANVRRVRFVEELMS
jgi:hypothetical protein